MRNDHILHIKSPREDNSRRMLQMANYPWETTKKKKAHLHLQYVLYFQGQAQILPLKLIFTPGLRTT